MIEQGQSALAEMLKESIRQGTTPSLTVISDSMSPLLRAGDQVGLQKLKPAEVQPGQIITFLQSVGTQDLITHRVAGTIEQNGEEKIATYGDRTLLFDFPVAHDDLVGLVVWRRRNERIFKLLNGHGFRLNERLAKQASSNLAQTSGFVSDRRAVDSEDLLRFNENCRQQRKKLGTRIYLRLNYYWASVLTLYAEYLTRSGEEN